MPVLLYPFSKGSAPLACLNAMLHHHSRGPNDMFYKVDGRMSCYGINVGDQKAVTAHAVLNDE